jgi:hypothetical protein
MVFIIKGTKPMSLTKKDVQVALKKNLHQYTDSTGKNYLAARPDDIVYVLRGLGWRLPRMDIFDFRNLGFEVVEARYTQGVRPGRPCQVVVYEPIGE